MTKHFCDKCGDELTEENGCDGGIMSPGRLGTEISFRPKGLHPFSEPRVLKVEIMTSLDGTANAGDFCKYCVINAVASLDDRPKAG